MRRQSWWHVVSANSRSTDAARAVLLVLSMHATRNGFAGLPIKLIAEFAGLTTWKARKAINTLLGLREIRLAWRGTGRGNDVYRITVSAIREVDTKRYRVKIAKVPEIEEFPSLRVMEEPKEGG